MDRGWRFRCPRFAASKEFLSVQGRRPGRKSFSHNPRARAEESEGEFAGRIASSIQNLGFAQCEMRASGGLREGSTSRKSDLNPLGLKTFMKIGTYDGANLLRR